MKAKGDGKLLLPAVLAVWAFFGKPNLAEQVFHSSEKYFQSVFSLLRLIGSRMFVRGLQGSYNLYTPQLGIHIPHGDVLLFGACCGQIMFAWLCSPETIPKEYDRWYV